MIGSKQRAQISTLSDSVCKSFRQFLLSGSWQMSHAVIKKYAECRAVYSVCFGKTIKENHVVLLHEINYIPSVILFACY